MASYMIEQGYENVWTVVGGGKAMEKFFDHVIKGKVISPMGTVNTGLSSPRRGRKP